MKKKLLKPSTVIKKWGALCKKIKNDKTKRKTPGSQEAKLHAAMAGMKSMLEVVIAADLDARGIGWLYEHEALEYNLCLGWKPECNVRVSKYVPDFTLANGVLIEGKGKMTLETRKKMVAVKRCHPDRRICMVFGYAKNKLSTRPNSTRYWQWAEAEGFPWSEGVVREEWIV